MNAPYLVCTSSLIELLRRFSMAAALAASAGTAAAIEPATTQSLLIFDASGSMWGKVEGTPKVEIARKAATDFAERHAPEAPLGLMAYGHRSQGDCGDIEVLVPVGEADPTRFRKALEKISPRGKTPLSKAIAMGAEALRYREKPATLIVVTDGLETCQVDPCAAARELVANAKDLRIHVIGFDIRPTEREQLQCIADRGRGKFLVAGSGRDLQLALGAVAKPVAAAPPVSIDLKATPADPIAGKAFEVTWAGDGALGDAITVGLREAPAGGGSSSAPADIRARRASLLAPETPGEYEVRYIQRATNRIAGRTTITVKAAEAQVVAPPTVPGNATFEVRWIGPKNADDYIYLVDGNQAPPRRIAYADLKQGSPLKLRAPGASGEYEVRYVTARGKVLAHQRVTVAMEPIVLESPAKVKAGQSFTVNWKATSGPGDYITIVASGAAPDAHLSYHDVARGNPARLVAPPKPGSYEIRYVGGSTNAGVLERRSIAVE